ncbi:hypothetical protein [Vibrio sp. TRT 17S01]|uniref:hypothetical protein n=1 Tax=Vibrio sp. TRT 17S01 TaxID=3418505 RepID=UPI003CF82B4B
MKSLIKFTLVTIGCVIAFFLIIIFVVNPLIKCSSDNRAPIGSSEDDHYIRIQGIKPSDATVTAQAIFYGGGEDCTSFFWSASDGKKRQGGKGVFRLEYNFSDESDRYELRIPYLNYASSGCDMKLYQIIVSAKNAFDPIGFAELRIYPPTKSSEKSIALSSIIEARDCDGEVYMSLRKVQAGAIGCYFYINSDKQTKEKEFNAESIYLDFSKFSDSTIIHYDILAGENYRNEPLNPESEK